MDADVTLWAELHNRGIESISSLSADDAIDLASRFAVWIPVETYVSSPWLAPYAVRRVRNRTDQRVNGPKRDMWGFPDERGYFTDDNSLIKQIHKGKRVKEIDSPYGTSKLSSGMVCCHVWSGTTQNPLLFSFIPNLVWLPKSLAPLSDNHDGNSPHPVHGFLKSVSLTRFREYTVHRGSQRVQRAWDELDVSFVGPSDRRSFELADAEKLVKLASGRVDRFVNFIEELIEPDSRPQRFSRRYHAGVGRGIDQTFPAVDLAVSVEDLRILLSDIRSCR